MYKFENFPKEIKKSVYEKEQNDFINFVSKNKNIISVYSIGELGLFGVSDLDYLIVYKNTIDENNILNFRKKYKLIDTVLFLDINNIDNKNYISHHMLYNLVFGEDLNLSFDKSNKNLNIIYTWKICFFSLLRNFYFYKFNKKISVKNLLSQINDIRYPIFFLKNLGIKNSEYDEFINDYTTYRSNYFKHNNYKELENYLDRAIKISWDIVFDLKGFLLNNNKEKNIYGRFPTIFKTFETNSDYIKNTERKLKNIGKISRFLYLPLGFNYKIWTGSLKNDLNKIITNNKYFLNFYFDGLMLTILLYFKYVFDFITLRIFK